MKKIGALMLVAAGVCSFAACGQGGTNQYNLDYRSTEVQPMSEDKATREVLSETSKYYLGGITVFSDLDADEYSKRTYNDIKNHIGKDATQYNYDDSTGCECYTWIASDNDTSKLAIEFLDGKIKYKSSTNLNLDI